MLLNSYLYSRRSDMIRRDIVFLIITFTVLISCTTNNAGERVVRKWHGKKIKFPANIDQMTVGSESIDNEMLKEFKIFIYKDSSSCNECNLQLTEWKSVLLEIKKASNVGLLFVVNSLSKEDIFILKTKHEFHNPIIADELNIIDKLNQFPDNPIFHCFLLNQDNEVLLIGDPCNSEELWGLYKKTILKSDF